MNVPGSVITQLLMYAPGNYVMELCRNYAPIKELCQDENFWTAKIFSDFPRYCGILQSDSYTTFDELTRSRNLSILDRFNNRISTILVDAHTTLAKIFQIIKIHQIIVDNIYFDVNPKPRVRQISLTSGSWTKNFPDTTSLYEIAVGDNINLYLNITGLIITGYHPQIIQ